MTSRIRNNRFPGNLRPTHRVLILSCHPQDTALLESNRSGGFRQRSYGLQDRVVTCSHAIRSIGPMRKTPGVWGQRPHEGMGFAGIDVSCRRD